jgi:hypothetical protein
MIATRSAAMSWTRWRWWEARPHPVPLPRERENVDALLEKAWLLVPQGLEAAMAGESV